MTFNIGDRVVWINRSDLDAHNEYEDDPCTRGEVKAVDSDGKIQVKWDDNWVQPRVSTLSANELMPESEANDILSKLEDEYEAYTSPIRTKLEQAAKLLEEANELAKEHDRELAEWHDVTDPLLGAMGNIGWRTSSLSC